MKKKLRELADLVGGRVVGDGEVEISGVAPIEEAQTGEITFIANPRYLSKLKETRASAVIVSKEDTLSTKALLTVANPYLAFAKILTLYSARPYEPGGIDPRAWISSTAKIGKDVTIHPFVTIGENCRVGDRVTLYPGVYVGEDSTIGDESVLYPNVSVYAGTAIGKRVVLHSGVVVGSDGFAYVKDGRMNVKIPQVGKVQIEDDVEIGANTTIDRAALEMTIIQRGVKIDNLVQVAHNVVIGEDSVLAAQVGISGSAKIGNNVSLGGQVGVAGHLEIGDNVMIGAQSGVPNDLPPDGAYTGTPVMPHRQYLRAANLISKLPEMKRTLTDIERRLKKMEDILSMKGKEK